jgi:HK97 family phage major capsid protein
MDMVSKFETKAVLDAPKDLGSLYEDVMRTFEDFKQANDARIADIEHRQAADVLIEEKVNRIDAALEEHISHLDEMQRVSRRSVYESREGRMADEHVAAFDTYIRKGEISALIDLERKALSAGSDPDGGYLVPDDLENEIGKLLREGSPIRSIASIRQVSSAIYKKPLAVTGASAGWVGETGARPQTASPTLAELQFPAMELYAMPAVTCSPELSSL